MAKQPYPSFKMGDLVATPGAKEALLDAGKTPYPYVVRHLCCDWGDISDADKNLNDEALTNGERLLSAYQINDRLKIWIITEADRSVTTVLLPEEY